MKVPHNRLSHGLAEAQAVERVVASGHWAMGPEVLALEAELAAAVGRRHARAVGSGTAALRLALGALGVGAGDEVIVPAYSCVMIVNAVLACGARPVAADVEPGSWNLDAAAVRPLLGARSRAIVVVHSFGLPAAVPELVALGVPVIEDCAHGIGAVPASGVMGRLGQLAVCSFHATKLIGAGEGGAVLCDDPDLASAIGDRRDGAGQQPAGDRLNDKMNDLEAALARAQLQGLAPRIEARARLAARYHEALEGLPVGRPDPGPGRIWYRYAIEPRTLATAELELALGELGVATARPIWNWHASGALAALPVARRAFEGLLSLPLYPTLSEREQEHVIAALWRSLDAS